MLFLPIAPTQYFAWGTKISIQTMAFGSYPTVQMLQEIKRGGCHHTVARPCMLNVSTRETGGALSWQTRQRRRQQAFVQSSSSHKNSHVQNGKQTRTK